MTAAKSILEGLDFSFGFWFAPFSWEYDELCTIRTFEFPILDFSSTRDFSIAFLCSL